MATVRFWAVGDLLVDVLVSGADHDARVRLAPGGSAFNAAVAAVAAGAEATVVGRVGDDAAGRMLQAELAARGVDQVLSIDPVAPTGTFVRVDDEARIDRGSNASFGPQHLPATIDTDVVLVSGYLPESTAAAALAQSRASWTALAAARLERLPESGNAIFVNEDEAHALTGLGAETAVTELGRRYELVCITLGAHGAIGLLNGVHESVDAAALVSGDRPGAGDAFAAAVLVRLAGGGTLREALGEGCRAGAVALEDPH